jgi:hypothetical protein
LEFIPGGGSFLAAVKEGKSLSLLSAGRDNGESSFPCFSEAAITGKAPFPAFQSRDNEGKPLSLLLRAAIAGESPFPCFPELQ